MTVLESFSLKGKVGLVTGGAGLYGWQVVQTLAEAGAKTFAADCDIEKQEDVAKRLRTEGLDVTAVQYDQSDEESIQAMLREIVAQTRAGGHSGQQRRLAPDEELVLAGERFRTQHGG